MDDNGSNRCNRGVFLTRVVANVPLCREHWRVTLEVEDFPEAAPGQFVQILCSDPNDNGWTGGAFIRRPFSIGGLRRKGHRAEIDILHRAIGIGTRWLSRLHVGDPVNILGPLGLPFPIDSDGSIAYLVGGGIGLPPLIWLAEALQSAGKQTVVFTGARSADLIPLSRIPGVPVSGDEPMHSFEEFAVLDAPVLLSTDDGSLGRQGRIPDVFDAWLNRQGVDIEDTTVYTCGPEPMMAAVAEVCERRSLRCLACLERVMACGMGTCQSCIVRVADPAAPDGWRYRLCCTDGPVFDSRNVIWHAS